MAEGKGKHSEARQRAEGFGSKGEMADESGSIIEDWGSWSKQPPLRHRVWDFCLLGPLVLTALQSYGCLSLKQDGSRTTTRICVRLVITNFSPSPPVEERHMINIPRGSVILCGSTSLLAVTISNNSERIPKIPCCILFHRIWNFLNP